MSKYWIQKALAKHEKGALHRELGIPKGKIIPNKELKKIEHAPLGTRVEGHKVTHLLKERATLAETLRKFHKK
ncbi:MAG: hypothetical protein ABSG05_03540 [Candidatus Pacearchaeota archaeon]|jgi:hypothetical protein